MSRISTTIIEQLKRKEERNWEKVFWLIDFHETLFPAHWNKNQENKPYPDAVPVLAISNPSPLITV